MTPLLTANQVIYNQRVALVREIGLTGKAGADGRDTQHRRTPLAAASGFDSLSQYASLVKGTVEPFIDDRGVVAGQVLRIPQIMSDSLFLPPMASAYRPLYKQFLTQYTQYGGQLPSEIHVDHVLNRVRGEDFGMGLVRMALVEARVNCSVGAGYEKLASSLLPRLGGPQRNMDLPILFKCLGSECCDDSILITIATSLNGDPEDFRRALREYRSSLERLKHAEDELEEEERVRREEEAEQLARKRRDSAQQNENSP